MSQTRLVCPYCGMEPHALADYHAIPEHSFDGRKCPGSGQYPRNAESDKRPLWKETQRELSRSALSKIYCAETEKKPTVTLFTCEALALASRSDRLDRWRNEIREVLRFFRLGCETTATIKLESLLGES